MVHILRNFINIIFGVRVNGGRYRGQLQGNLPHGAGVLRYSGGSVYKGQFQNGVKNGFGHLVHKSGFSYRGRWKNGKTFGKGDLKYKNGDTYSGETNSSLRNGSGTLYIKNLEIQISGEWKNDEIIGNFKLMHPDFSFNGIIQLETKLSQYSSAINLINFLKENANGVIRFPDGTAFEGIWIDHENANCIKMTDSSGIIWIGNIRKNRLDGLAQATLPSGEVYDCLWRDGIQVRAIGGKIDGDRPRYLLN